MELKSWKPRRAGELNDMSAIAERPVTLFDIPGCEFTPVSLTLPDNLPFDHWQRIGRQLQLADVAVQWWIGDWLNYGEPRYGEKYAQALEETGRAKQTLMNYAHVARKIEPYRRRYEVDFSTHAEVASLEPADQEKVLAKAAKEQQSRRKVRREAERIKRDKRPKPIDTELVMSKDARAFVDEYMSELAAWVDNIPTLLSGPEKEVLEKMLILQGNRALWLKQRTRQADYDAIVQLFSFDEGTPGMERASQSDISAWLDNCHYYMSESELSERLDLMVEKKMLEVKSVEDSRQEGRRGTMIDLYGLHPDYQMQLENAA